MTGGGRRGEMLNLPATTMVMLQDVTNSYVFRGRASRVHFLYLSLRASLVLLVILCGLRALRHVTLYESQDRKANAFIDNGMVVLKHRSARGVYMVDATSISGWSLYFLAYQKGTRSDGQSESWLFFTTTPLILICAVSSAFWLYRYRRRRPSGFETVPTRRDSEVN